MGLSIGKELLISIIVLSYNSSNTIIETLNSILHQSYHNLELIISDDGSVDDTLLLVDNWIKANNNRFSRIIFIKDHPNYGVSKNLNNAVKVCKGDWIKIIAADDILEKECIYWCVNAATTNPTCKVFQADEVLINETGETIGYSYVESYRMKKIGRMDNANKQYRYFLYDDIKLSPSLFFERNSYNCINGCDEEIRNIEDYPLKLRFLKNGFQMGYINQQTVRYRIHQSVSHDNTQCYRKEHWHQRKAMVRKYCYPNISLWRLDYWLTELNDILSFYISTTIFKNKKTLFSKMFNRTMLIINPKYIRFSIIKVIAKKQYAKTKDDMM